MDFPIDFASKSNTALRRGTTGIVVAPSADDRSILFRVSDRNAMRITSESKVQIATRSTYGQLTIGGTSEHIALHHTTGLSQQPMSTTKATIGIDSTGDIDIDTNVAISGTLSATIPIATSSGGTGYSSYELGDLLIGNTQSSLSKLSMNAPNGSVLVRNANGLAWGYSQVTQMATSYGTMSMISNSDYTIGPYVATVSTDATALVSIPSTTLSMIANGINRPPASASYPDVVMCTGTIYPASASTTITGVGTLFTQELSVGCVISLMHNGVVQSRKVVTIVSDTSLTVNTAFAVLNTWVLGSPGTLTNTPSLVRFGVGAFTGNATTANVVVTSGITNVASGSTWTIDFWLRPGSVTTAQRVLTSTTNAFALQINMTNAGRLTLSLGQGTSFNIANAATTTGLAFVVNVYRLVSLTFDGSAYRLWTEAGAPAATITSALKIPTNALNGLAFGAFNSITFNGCLDNVRVSNINRYPTNVRIDPTAAFALDVNCIALNNFDTIASLVNSDETTTIGSITAMKGFQLDGALVANTVYYGYAIAKSSKSTPGNHSLTPQSGLVTFSSNSNRPPISSRYDTFNRLPCYMFCNASSLLNRYIVNSGLNAFTFVTPISIGIDGLTNVAQAYTRTNLQAFIPVQATSIRLLISHTKTTTVAGGVQIGHRLLGYLTTVLTSSLIDTKWITYEQALLEPFLDTAQSSGAGNYTILIAGFSL